MTDTFDIVQAQRLWQNSRNGLFDFAEYLTTAEDVNIRELAEKVRRSPSLLHGYRKAGKFWLDVKGEFPQAEVWRDHLEIGFWTPLARLCDNKTLDLGQCVDWLIDAMDEGWTVEEFKAKLPVDGGNNTGMVRKLWHIVNYVKAKIFGNESLGLKCTQAEYKNAMSKLNEAVAELERILAASGNTLPNNGEN